MKVISILFIFILVSAVGFSQTTWYVDDDAPNDPGPNDPTISDPLEDGSSDHPFDMIQEAIAYVPVVNGDAVSVATGTYVEMIDFLGKAITVKSAQGANSTIIDGNSASNVVQFLNAEGADSVLNGFTVTNGNTVGYGGGIVISEANPTIINNIITGNWSTGGGGLYLVKSSPIIANNIISDNHVTGPLHPYGGGLYGYHSCHPVITNNIIYRNTTGRGGGLCFYTSCSPTLTNNTIVGNEANGTAAYDGGGGICAWQNCYVTVVNCIFWGNYAATGSGKEVNASSCTLSYSDVDGGQASTAGGITWGSGMIDADPLCVDYANDDFHLTYDSPCRDTGDNTAVTDPQDFEGDPRIAWSGIVDMGADEFYTHLYVTGNQTPGGNIKGKLVGVPGTSPTCLIIGSGVYDPPKSTQYGDFYIKPPRIIVPLIPIPANGILVVPAIVPPTPPAPYDVPTQGLVGQNSDSLTNLCLIEVR